jgi:cytoskeleton protein RodZ
MKTVGKQLEEARLAKNWTPELASRETKIKVDRLHDLEGDDYSHFASPTYARGFVRTYARALGLDEYRILRQLDNKLPDDDSSNIATETGVAYLPETSMPPRAAHRDYTGLYIVAGLGAVVTLAIVFVLFEAYRVGELSNWFASSPENVASAAGTNANGTPANPTADADNRAKPIDSNTPPPIIEAANATNTTNGTNAAADAAPAIPGLVSPKALPVDPSELTNAAVADTNAAPLHARKALPVDPSELTNAAVTDTNAAPMHARKALPVDPSELTNAAAANPGSGTLVAVNTPAPSSGTDGTNKTNGTGAKPAPSTSSPVSAPVDPSTQPAATNAAPQDAAAGAVGDAGSNKRLVLTASRDCFVRVTNLDAADGDKPLYAAVLHNGQSVGFDGRKFSINVGIPSAVGIKLDGVNYGPHSDQQAPETFTVESHLP